MLSHNLPLQLTSFIGREREIAEVSALLSISRLVTLTGTGGCGKTRLALQVIGEIAQDPASEPLYPDGVWLVEFAALNDASLVPDRVAATLRIQEQPGQPMLTALIEYLKPKRLLLLLDNCEHLIDACAQMVDVLLHACPHLQILATSRESLNVGGERLYRVPSLSVPDIAQPVSAHSLAGYESVRLFADRATAVQVRFALADQNAIAVAQICEGLDGIPLAIELAAARVASLSVAQIASRLEDRFQLLTGGSRTALPRQQTLRAAVDWSYDLLSEPERILLRRLSVFVGGWTLEAAGDVCTDEEPAEPADTVSDGIRLRATAILNLLTQLVNKSLVHTSEEGATTRYRLLETIRQYGRDRLRESSESARSRNRHLSYYAAFAEAAGPKLRGAEPALWIKLLDAELDNLRAALDWSFAAGSVLDGLRLTYGAHWFFYARGYWSESYRNFERLLGRPENSADPTLRAKALTAWTWLKQHLSEPADAEMTEAIQLAEGLHDQALVAYAKAVYAATKLDSEAVVAQRLSRQGLLIARAIGDRWAAAWSLTILGLASVNLGEYAVARQLYEESLTEFRALGDRWFTAMPLTNLAALMPAIGDLSAGRRYGEEVLGIFREIEDKRNVAVTLYILGILAHLDGRYADAANLFREALPLYEDLGRKQYLYRPNLLDLLRGLAYVSLHQGNPAQSAAYFREALELFQTFENESGMLACVAGLAAVAAASGSPKYALKLFAATHGINIGPGVANQAIDQSEYHRNIAALRERLPESEFNAAWAEGLALTPEQAIAEALRGEPPSDLEAVSRHALTSGAPSHTEGTSAASSALASEPVSLRICALDDQIFRAGQIVTGSDWNYSKPRELFLFLLFHPPQTKEQVGLALWPDASAAKLRSNFRVALYTLRRALGRADWILYEDERYGFNRALGHWCDVEEFEAALKEARQALAQQAPDRAREIERLAQATALYRGDFLDDLNENDWVLIRREEMRRLNLEALLTLGGQQFAQAQYEQAAATYRKALAYDNYLEEAHRELMRCLAEAGDVLRALQHYQQFRDWLRSELKAEPAPETRHLYERLRRAQYP